MQKKRDRMEMNLKMKSSTIYVKKSICRALGSDTMRDE